MGSPRELKISESTHLVPVNRIPNVDFWYFEKTHVSIRPIPHPRIYLVLEFEASWLKMTELLNGRHFEGSAAGKGAAPPRTALQRSGDIASQCPILRFSFGPNLGQIWAKSVKKRQSYGIFTVSRSAAGGAAGGPLLVVGSAQNFSHKILIPQGCFKKNFSPIG